MRLDSYIPKKTVKLTWNGSLKCHSCNRGRSYTMRVLTYATNGVEPASRALATSQRSIPQTPLGNNRANPTRSRRTDTWFSTRSVHGSLIVVTPGKLGKKRPGKSRETSRPPTTPRQTNLHRNRCFSNKFSTTPPRPRRYLMKTLFAERRQLLSVATTGRNIGSGKTGGNESMTRVQKKEGKNQQASPSFRGISARGRPLEKGEPLSMSKQPLLSPELLVGCVCEWSRVGVHTPPRG